MFCIDVHLYISFSVWVWRSWHKCPINTIIMAIIHKNNNKEVKGLSVLNNMTKGKMMKLNLVWSIAPCQWFLQFYIDITCPAEWFQLFEVFFQYSNWCINGIVTKILNMSCLSLCTKFASEYFFRHSFLSAYLLIPDNALISTVANDGKYLRI